MREVDVFLVRIHDVSGLYGESHGYFGADMQSFRNSRGSTKLVSYTAKGIQDAKILLFQVAILECSMGNFTCNGGSCGWYHS